jgi:OFA family oxalate/formate antiporter-like MFS transporter
MSTSNSGSVKSAEKSQNRNIILFFAALMQFSVGISYVWSVFQPFVMKQYGWNATTASMTYTVMVLAFVLGGTIGGRIQEKLSPKIIIILGGIIMAIGSFLSYFTPASNPLFLYATFGILSGLGMGFVYNTAISLSQKWFYDKRGLQEES